MQLAEQLRERITDSEWAAGSRLPSEQDFANEYGVSRPTVRVAMQKLQEAGLIRVRHGAGTFVTELGGAIRSGLQELRSTSQIIAEQGHHCEVVYRSREIRSATDEETLRLQRDTPPPVLAYERSFVTDGQPVAFEEGLIATDLFPVGTDFDSVAGSIFEFLEPHGLLPDQASADVRAVLDENVGWGKNRPNPPVYLRLEQTQSLPTGTCITWSRTHFVQDRFQFRLIRRS
ncbi:GntR family transcriptional regulator [Streptomyces sp. NPDC090106]|uniref:GntR family transcriptional regulator n=1 Tax=Streptomyces sp. NPDC090106 TaxID=3365946 RepID=UPI0038253EFC